MPFHDDADFACYAMLSACRPRGTRALLTYESKYALLAALIDEVRTTLDPRPAEVIVNVRMPGIARMPAGMFGDDIVVVDDVSAEVRRLRREGARFVAIRESLIRYPLEAGNNTLQLAWFGAPEGDRESFLALVNWLVTRGFRQRRLRDCPGGAS
ncbi:MULTISPECIES: hypothetical protein [unclassified Paraburkholderia]|uniref:hypothetical protein n=1 Tax=unclassified Paraburkholderia TaxID=2615204 RepID=UPI002AB0E05E|nr:MULTISPECIES: hypothetical protein [unclassified Paraburkholderia]